MGALSDSMRDAVIKRITELEKRNIIDAMLFDAEEFKAGYKQGVEWAFAEIRKQIELCAVNQTEYPILHLYGFIDRTLCKKK